MKLSRECRLGRALTVQLYGNRLTFFVWETSQLPMFWKPKYWRVWRLYL